MIYATITDEHCIIATITDDHCIVAILESCEI